MFTKFIAVIRFVQVENASDLLFSIALCNEYNIGGAARAVKIINENLIYSQRLKPPPSAPTWTPFFHGFSFGPRALIAVASRGNI